MTWHARRIYADSVLLQKKKLPGRMHRSEFRYRKICLPLVSRGRPLEHLKLANQSRARTNFNVMRPKALSKASGGRSLLPSPQAWFSDICSDVQGNNLASRWQCSLVVSTSVWV